MRKTLALTLAALLLVSAGGRALAATDLLETGSSLLYPLMNLWVASYTQGRSDVQITTQSTGSGTGISQAVGGVAQIGASDAYMADAQLKNSPMFNIPLAISAQQINYNIPGLNTSHLNLSGPVLAAIYSGQIQYWDDAKIKSINKAYASKLPHTQIIPIRRSDGSGDTFIFTQYLSKSTPSWASGPGYGTTVSWPSVASSVGANGNPGMVQTCQNTPGSIAYIGVSFLNQTDKAGLGYAALENQAGKFVLPTEGNIAAAAAATDKSTPADERLSLIFAPGANSYPIINYEYAIVNPKQGDPGKASELKKFLDWALSEGQSSKYLNAVHFLPLPAAVQKMSRAQVAKIQ
ncbi:MAG TPA: phosphate ABC transporter substrate-binding protein PstS [Candidatus Acidoferrum sp.]|nr:phosphate ABC transporter substrate-binding protein PstS [Candidatus Acidoferrum sp.]